MRLPLCHLVLAGALPASGAAAADGDPPYAGLGRPRLYFTPSELAELRRARTQGVRARIWQNLAASAEWCLRKTPRSEWIAPVTPDPIYENLYDRFYGMMQDMSITEHLCFAYAYSGDRRYLEGARTWTMNSARIWSREADAGADASKAYAVMRLVKALALGYDVLFHDLSDAERDELRRTMVRIGDAYYKEHVRW